MRSRWRTMKRCCRGTVRQRYDVKPAPIVGVGSYAIETFRYPLLYRQIHHARNRFATFFGPPKPCKNRKYYPRYNNSPTPGTGPK